MEAVRPDPKRRLLLTGAGIAALAMPELAWSQAYPSRPVRVVVGYSAGGPVDSSARKLVPALQRELGQNIVVENRGGASGIVGADLVAKAPPDGYTLLFAASPTQTMAPHMRRTMPFDPLKDYTPVCLAVSYALALIVNRDFPGRTFADFVAYARSKPGTVTFGSAGVGASNHLSGELMKKLTGIEMTHVPYKGNADALTDVIGGRITCLFNSVGDSLGFVNGGKVRALAVTSKSRSRVMPAVPTLIESGLPGFDVTAWYSLQGPPNLPAPIVATLNAAVRRALSDPQVVSQYVDAGYDVIPSTPEELDARIRTDYQLWSDVAGSLPKSD